MIELDFNRQQSKKFRHGDELDVRISNMLDSLFSKCLQQMKIVSTEPSEVGSVPGLDLPNNGLSRNKTKMDVDPQFSFHKKMRLS